MDNKDQVKEQEPTPTAKEVNYHEVFPNGNEEKNEETKNKDK